ncbi:MAG: mechanosensitive ion channel [Chromatiales bacterium]|nr:mechanosensitive ion channel [Chromatiales bacterium]
MEELTVQLQEMVALYGVKVIAALAIFIVGRWIAKFIKKMLIKAMARSATDETISGFVANVAYIALLAFVIIAALNQLGIATTSFIAVLGAAGLAIGLALQGSLANFASGFLLIVFRPFKVGDFIEGAGVAGIVEQIQIFNTVMRTGDNKVIIIPNAKLGGDNIVNYSTKETRRVDLTVGVGYDDDLSKVKSVLNDIVAKESRALADPEPLVAVAELADSSVNLVVRVWVKSADYWGVTFAMTEAIKVRFDEEGISIPYPQQDVHMYEQKVA